MPWLLCSKPLLKPSNWDSFEVTGIIPHPHTLIHTHHTLTSQRSPSYLCWNNCYNSLYFWKRTSSTPSPSCLPSTSLLITTSLFLENCKFHSVGCVPIVTSPTLLCSGAALVVAVVGLKLVRSAYTELSRQSFVLIFALFFFNFDYAHLSEGLPLNYFIIAILFNKVCVCV